MPDLHEAGVVGHHDLERAVGLRAQEAGLLGGVAHERALLVDDPGAAEVVDERPAVLLEDQLLAELEGLDRRVLAVAVAVPAADHPGERRAQLVDVLGDLERHDVHSSVGRMRARLVVKVTCGAEDAERCNQAFTVAAAAVAAGADVGLWLTGEAAWFASPGGPRRSSSTWPRRWPTCSPPSSPAAR